MYSSSTPVAIIGLGPRRMTICPMALVIGGGTKTILRFITATGRTTYILIEIFHFDSATVLTTNTPKDHIMNWKRDSKRKVAYYFVLLLCVSQIARTQPYFFFKTPLDSLDIGAARISKFDFSTGSTTPFLADTMYYPVFHWNAEQTWLYITKAVEDFGLIVNIAKPSTAIKLTYNSIQFTLDGICH